MFLEQEPLTKLNNEQKAYLDKIAEHPYSLFMSHLAGWSSEAHERVNTILIDQIKEVL